jgi:glycosyltransferase involved in cell wall biosynthesis
MSKRIILVFIDWYLPGYKAGGPITSCANLLQHLSDEFEFCVVTRDTDYTESEPYPGIQSDSWNILPDGTRVYYFSGKQLNRKNIFKLISETPHDAVYLNGVYSVYFTLIPLLILRKHAGERVILAARGMLAESAINVKRTKKKIFLFASKSLGLFRFVVFHASTEEEKKDIEREFGPECEVIVAGNLGSKVVPGTSPIRLKTPGAISMVSIARISPEKNLLFGLRILEKVIGLEISFDIYGPIYNDDYWKECLKIISGLPPEINVNYCGSLESEKVTDTLGKYHFLFMPTRGENFGHIILQAFSAGCPVIISDRTPWKQLQEKKCGWELSLDNENGFVEAIRKAAEMDQKTFNHFSNCSFGFALQCLADKSSEEANRRLFR